MLNDLFYAVLGMLPWTCALIAALLVLRHFARTTLSARFFRLAWLILAVRLALPVSFAVPVQDRLAPLSIPLPTAAVRQAALPAAPAESGGAQQAAASGPGKAVPVPSAPAPAGPLRSRPGLAGAVWLVGAALCLAARLAAYGTSMRRLRRGRVPLADETLADACRAAFGRSMRVYAVAGLDTPMLAGLLRPAVYLPEGAGLRADTLRSRQEQAYCPALVEVFELEEHAQEARRAWMSVAPVSYTHLVQIRCIAIWCTVLT